MFGSYATYNDKYCISVYIFRHDRNVQLAKLQNLKPTDFPKL